MLALSRQPLREPPDLHERVKRLRCLLRVLEAARRVLLSLCAHFGCTQKLREHVPRERERGLVLRRRGAQRACDVAEVSDRVPCAAGALDEPVDLLLHFAEKHDRLPDGERRR